MKHINPEMRCIVHRYENNVGLVVRVEAPWGDFMQIDCRWQHVDTDMIVRWCESLGMNLRGRRLARAIAQDLRRP